MKKLFSYLLVLAMLIGCVGMLTACGGGEEAYVLPDGYTMYEDEYISFAYPEHWTKTDGNIPMLQNTENTNNITIAYETATDLYAELDEEAFASNLQPSLEAVGMKISDASITQHSRGDLDITELRFGVELMGISMTQTLYAVTASDRTYVVTVTEVVPDPAIAENVFASLTTSK